MNTRLFRFSFYLLLLTPIVNILAYNSLYVSDPRGFKGGQGSIDSATIITRPKGLFMEVTMILNFSANTLYFKNSDTLEVVFNFDLPENASVTESWLWLTPDLISRGKLFDRWTATTIYENIVKRRRDPSILRKIGIQQHELRIFPLEGNSYRKVKIVYLVPMTLQSSVLSNKIAASFLSSSKVPLQSINLICLSEKDYETPKLEYQGNEINLYTNIDPIYGKIDSKPLALGELLTGIIVKYPTVNKQNYYYSSFEYNKEKYYQIAIQPGIFTDKILDQNILICVDYATVNHDKNWAEIQSQLLKYFTSNSKFNVCFYNKKLESKLIYSDWMPINLANIKSCGDFIKSDLTNLSSLHSILFPAIKFIKNNNVKGKIYLITQDFSYNTLEKANEFISIFQEETKNQIPLIISDVSLTRSSCSYIGNSYFCNNEYLFQNLARISKGAYFYVPVTSQYQVIADGIKYVIGTIFNFDIYVKPELGLSYNRYTTNFENFAINEGLIQIGKFSGQAPFQVEVSGFIDGNSFNSSFIIPKDNQIFSDATIPQVWAGYFLRNHELNSNNFAINNCIALSQEYHVLSTNTAFLCLEDTSYYCFNCLDESKFKTNVEDHKKDSFEVSAFPNPFIDQIEFSISASFITESPVAKILDIQGRLVDLLGLPTLANNKYKFNWEPNSGIKPGIYLAVIQTQNSKKTIKLIKQ